VNRVSRLGRAILEVALKTALVVVDALSTGPGSATSSLAHLPVVLRRRSDELAARPVRPTGRFRRRTTRRTN